MSPFSAHVIHVQEHTHTAAPYIPETPPGAWLGVATAFEGTVSGDALSMDALAMSDRAALGPAALPG